MTSIDCLVVGGGSSGLAAAIAAAEDGGSVMLVDEWPTLGGRLRYRRLDIPHAGGTTSPRRLIASLVDRAEAAGVVLRPSTVAWAVFAGSRGLEVGIRSSRADAEAVVPTRLILATGTTDRAAMVPGATCPGVLTARALQILLTIHGVRPGHRFVILGEAQGDELTADIGAAGGSVVRTVSTSELSSVSIHGDAGVSAISIGDERIDADIVVTALGTLQDTQLAGMLGCDFISDGAWPPRPRREANGALSVTGVFACGTSAIADSIVGAIIDGVRVGRGHTDEAGDDAFLNAMFGEGRLSR